jgi:hypothetical protein
MGDQGWNKTPAQRREEAEAAARERRIAEKKAHDAEMHAAFEAEEKKMAAVRLAKTGPEHGQGIRKYFVFPKAGELPIKPIGYLEFWEKGVSHSHGPRVRIEALEESRYKKGWFFGIEGSSAGTYWSGTKWTDELPMSYWQKYFLFPIGTPVSLEPIPGWVRTPEVPGAR